MHVIGEGDQCFSVFRAIQEIQAPQDLLFTVMAQASMCKVTVTSSKVISQMYYLLYMQYIQYNQFRMFP